jgi:hypothetical protein
MKNIGYVVRLYDVRNSFAYGLNFRDARVFLTREAARVNVRTFRGIGRYTKPDQILQVELTKGGKTKKIIKVVR